MNDSFDKPIPTDDEIKTVVDILSRLQPGELPLDLFLQTARLTVTPIVEVVPVRKTADGSTEVLLIERDGTDPVWSGKVHTPGTIIRSSDTDSQNGDAFRRILQGEMQGISTGEPVYVGSMLHRVKRGMEQIQVYVVEVHGEPTVGKFYNANALPENLVDTQTGFIQAAVLHYIAFEQTN